MTSDPRVERTRAHVLDAARELVAQEGINALTYTTLAERAKVTRPTLYRHWPTPTALLVDLILDGPPTDYPAPSTDAPAAVRAFLRSLRDGMRNPALAGAFTALIGAAEYDLDARQALRRVTEDRLAALNTILGPSRVQVDGSEFAQLAGAVLFHQFIACGSVSDTFIDEITGRWHSR